MDYTDLTRVKQAMDSLETTSDPILSDFITRASRYLDRLCTSQPNVVDYFKAENVTGEILTNAVIDYAGRLVCYPHKPITTAVASLEYRYSLKDTYTAADLTLVQPMQESVMFEGGLPYGENIWVRIAYTGGLGATLADLPGDFIDIATVQTIRLYKEARSGLGDSIGVAELGTLVYTKAFPQRVVDTINVGGYARIAPWM